MLDPGHHPLLIDIDRDGEDDPPGGGDLGPLEGLLILSLLSRLLPGLLSSRF